jgi:hypothetical protein
MVQNPMRFTNTENHPTRLFSKFKKLRRFLEWEIYLSFTRNENHLIVEKTQKIISIAILVPKIIVLDLRILI